MFNCLCINDLFALQRYKNFWTFLLFPLCFKALSTIYLQVGNFSLKYQWRNAVFPAKMKTSLNDGEGSHKLQSWYGPKEKAK